MSQNVQDNFQINRSLKPEKFRDYFFVFINKELLKINPGKFHPIPIAMKQEAKNFLRESIIKFYKNNGENQPSTVRHFVQEGLSRSLVYKVLQQYKRTGDVKVKVSTGRPRTAFTRRNAVKVKRRFLKNPSTSVRVISQDIGLSKSSAQRIKAGQGGKTRRKQLAPAYKDNQLARVKSGCKKILQMTTDHFFIMDDEKYFHADPDEIPGLQFYTEFPESEVPVEAKVKKKSKFPTKFMVWQAISEDGRASEPFITADTINSKIYLSECIPKLVRFIDSFRRLDKPVMF